MRLSMLALGLLVVGCGASAPSPSAPIDVTPPAPAPYLLAFASDTTALLKPTDDTKETLEGQLKAAGTGTEKREVMRKLAILSLREAEHASDDAEGRKRRADTDRWARKAMKNEKDAYLLTDMEFVLMWNAWRSHLASAGPLAERFTRDHADIPELATIAWAIRGEVAMEEKAWRDAAQDYRYMLGNLDHPLYAFALYRTAAIHDGEGKKDDANQARMEALSMGCGKDAPPRVLQVSLAAAKELGIGGKTGKDGVMRPATCKAGQGSGPSEEEKPPEKP